MKKVNIAIDGPSGAGKSTIARRLAERFRITYVDTGAMYRAVALLVFRKGLDGLDEAAVVALLPEADVSLTYGEQGQRVLLSGEDVSEQIRRHEISEMTSRISGYPAVRAHLLGLQQRTAAAVSCVLDGRDIGTVVLPHADLKIFLTASPEERARRRHLELTQKGQEISFEQVLEDLIARDERDSSRAASPLKKADDAVEVDTTGKNLDESVELICEIFVKRLGEGPFCGGAAPCS
ncbi:MAG: (d)CMP kinase [Clostridia bacterium]|nr:(d)CMP kinase [Clostridia bacterium]